MSIYLKIPGINGNVTAEGFQNTIECATFSHGASRAIHTQTGRAQNREYHHPSFHDVLITKSLDKASPLLFQHFCEGKTIPQLEIHQTQSANNTVTYLKYVLHNVMISSRSIASQQGTDPIESIQFNYTKIEETYTPRDSSNQLTSPVTSGYDLEQAAVM